MTKKTGRIIVSIFIALVWVINGLLCKLLNLVPRHQQIVARILGAEHSVLLTNLIGLSEIFIGVWILTKIKTRFSAILQIVLVAVMNSIEFFLAHDLLLWGKFNSIFALLFIGIIVLNEFILKEKNSYSK